MDSKKFCIDLPEFEFRILLNALRCYFFVLKCCPLSDGSLCNSVGSLYDVLENLYFRKRNSILFDDVFNSLRDSSLSKY